MFYWNNSHAEVLNRMFTNSHRVLIINKQVSMFQNRSSTFYETIILIISLPNENDSELPYLERCPTVCLRMNI